MAVRLHTGGRTRAWLGRRFGGDERLGDRIWRRCLHLGGAVVLLLYVLPRDFFVVAPTDVVLLIALAAVLVLEALRRRAGWELPTIRPHEEGRVASYAYFAIGLSAAVLLLPEGLAVAAVLGAVFADPVAGELRTHGWPRPRVALATGLLFGALAVATLALLGPPGLPRAVAVGALMGAVGAAVEGPGSLLPLDDDLAMLVAPGALAAGIYLLSGATWPVPAV